MKTIMLTIAALAVSSTSHSLVADKFKCRMELKALESNTSVKVEKDFFIARLPLSASPAQDVRLTASQTREALILDTPKAEFRADLNFYYKHAVRTDGNGIPLEARQFTCFGLSGDYCEKPSGGGGGVTQTCSQGMIACLEPQDPFNSNFGWSPSVLIGGIPVFNEQTLGEGTTTIFDRNGNNVGAVNLSCQYMGSFQ